MKTYVLHSRYGVAVINAKSPEDALQLLKDREKNDIYLTHNITVDDFQILSQKPGIVIYYCAG